ncbi:Maf family protein [Methylocapsa palsarum]|uniref:Nucleoside triphosphate pyrophosphatase n=1 Tax=Methylocapsa palsarum TaxID=1612308 RepID=A0A1I3VUB2_9HYPH|nr:Maf family protein [Methylocapsa palsarum]SFJ98988.1 septum formation protein [Methylocapsa palsarum]
MSRLWRRADPLVLASKSTARRAVLSSAGVPFETCDVAIDERAVEAPLRAAGAGANEIALSLARVKALAGAAMLPGRLALGADQVLCFEGRLFSKPSSRSEAIAQIETLQGGVHELHSALCLVRDGEVLFEAAPVARIGFRTLSREFIAAYADAAGEAILSSVGAYQIEGLGVHLIERTTGDHSTILGLPLAPLLTFLREEGSLAG